MRRVDRVKKRFVEDGIEAALGNLRGRRVNYLRKADGEFEARLVALLVHSTIPLNPLRLKHFGIGLNLSILPSTVVD